MCRFHQHALYNKFSQSQRSSAKIESCYTSEMKTFSLLEAPSEKFVEIAVRKLDGNPKDYRDQPHPQEDFLLESKKYPIFVVADGVTLIQYILNSEPYPNPSPAGDVAKIFCQEFIKAAETQYETFTDTDMADCFVQANKAVQKYNTECGRTKNTVDYWKNDFYAATAAFVVIKDTLVYWGSICDSYVTHIQNGKVIFSSPQCSALKETDGPVFSGDPHDRKTKTIFTWKTKRNGINKENKRIGYGVITGEKESEKYLSSGKFKLKADDTVVLFTDGFEDFLKLPDFTSLLTTWPTDLESRIKNFTKKKSDEDPETFGHERSVIAIRI